MDVVGGAADFEKSYELGANSYVRKPISFGDFLLAVKHIDTYWASMNERAP